MFSRHKEITRREFLTHSSKIAGASVMGIAASVAFSESNKAYAAKPDRTVKIGQIGTSHAHASGKMKTLRKLDREYEVVGIVESNPARRKAMENHSAYKGLKWMTEEQLLNTKGLQAVAVETAKRDLVPTAVRCVNAGTHIHLDKPPGESLSAFKKLLDEATRRRLTVQMGYMFRNNPAFQFCFKAVREGWLGDIFEVHGVISKTINASRRKDLAQYPGGTMFNLGCHLIDSLVTVLGEPDRVTAYVRRTRPHQDNLADNQLAVFEYPKAVATVRSAMLEVEGFKRRQFVVCGDRGTVDICPIEPPHLKLALSEPRRQYNKGYQEVKLPPMPGRYDDQLVEFACIVRGEKESAYPPSHDLAVHEAVLQACGILSPRKIASEGYTGTKTTENCNMRQKANGNAESDRVFWYLQFGQLADSLVSTKDFCVSLSSPFILN